MSNRRDFIKKAALLTGSAGFAAMFPESIQRAMAINPDAGSTFMDAEHIVILMQENRSFDHCYGTLQGVRGFNDPHAIKLPNGNPVWMQTNKAGETYAPFRLNIKDTKATWMGSLPHSWTNQVDARNDGKMDRWLEVKQSGHPPFAKMPLTMGYYNREDLPFYYALADAFTVCDQNFCSSLTGTTPNRLYFWSGTIRENASEDVMPRVNNEDADYNTEVNWTTFPERLQANGVSWKFYQNELSVGVGFTGEEDSWLANFGDNPLEYFKQYQVRYSPGYIAYLPGHITKLTGRIAELKEKIKSFAGADAKKIQHDISALEAELARSKDDQKKYTNQNFQNLSATEKELHQKAFSDNRGDKNYHSLEPLTYNAGDKKIQMNIPKGDVLYEFRKDVTEGKLPLVSWLAAPENLSDHPSAPWYGAAYVSEVMNILTKDPEVWKKTIFILAYDENDGYFDHVPPFTAPYPDKPETGKVSEGIDSRLDYVTLDQDKKWRSPEHARESPIGLGFRVPLVIASPWSRGGVVNSQVFDHTSTLQFLEKFISQKTGKKIEETNITSWRRAVCGDLTSTFKPYANEQIALPAYVNINEFYGQIHDAKIKTEPHNFSKAPAKGIQEKGVRPACALPYQLSAEGSLSNDKKQFTLTLKAGTEKFGANSIGSAFNVYTNQKRPTRAYAVNAGSQVTDNFNIADFDHQNYHVKVYGPNGFFRSFMGNANDPQISVIANYLYDSASGYGSLVLDITNKTTKPQIIQVKDASYKSVDQSKTLKPDSKEKITIDLSKSFGWYDALISVNGVSGYERRFAGKVENGTPGFTDPAMGGVI